MQHILAENTGTAEAANSNAILRSMEEALTETAAHSPIVVINGEVPALPWDQSDLSRQFPLDALPSSIREFVWRIAMVHRTPVSLSACCTLATLSAAIGKGLRVRSIPNTTTPANLYVLVGASSGSGKSLAFKAITDPLRNISAVGLELQRGDAEERIQNIHALEAAIQDGRLRSEAPGLAAEQRNAILAEVAANETALTQLRADRPLPKLLCEDTTPAALVKLLSQNDECLASFSSDARDIATRLAGPRNSKKSTVEGILLKAYSEDPHQVERATQDPVELSSPNLTCLWLLQPDLVQQLFANTSLTDGGLLPRFLVHSANCEPTHIDRQKQFIPESVEASWRALIQELVGEYRLARDRREIVPSPQAVETLDHDYNRLVDRRFQDLADIGSYVARWNENAWRIALVLHAAEYGAQAHEHELSEETARCALSIMEWFAQEQLDVLAANREQARRERVELIQALVQDKGQVTARDIQRARIVPTSQEAEALLTEMRANDLLSMDIVTPATGGKKMRVFRFP